MANTYTQIHIHAVFAVQNRKCVINKTWEAELYMYISGIIKANGHKMIIINGMPDHLHVLFGLRPVQSLSDLMQDVKGSSSKWINEKKFTNARFSWQQGYGAFSYAKSDLPKVVNYIKNQKQHHGQKHFLEEYLELLKEFDIEFDERYTFKPID
jgi:REP element-mobilizing transposase RayT